MRPRAVIDIGTNSVLMLLGHRHRVFRDEARITRLGEGAAQRGALSMEAIERTIAVLEEYRAIAQDADAELVAVATEGLRMASNQDEFLRRAQAALGVAVQLISGEEEARLSYLSVARDGVEAGPLRVLDIGGGSTELVVGDGEEVLSQRSHKIGSVRLTERYVRADPPSTAEVEALEAAAAAAFAEQAVTPHPELHGLAGTVTTAVAVMLGLTTYSRRRVDGTRWSIEQIRDLRDQLAGETLAQRSRRPCLPRGRADVIVAGLCILRVAMDHCGAQTLVARDRGLRYALL